MLMRSIISLSMSLIANAKRSFDTAATLVESTHLGACCW